MISVINQATVTCSAYHNSAHVWSMQSVQDGASLCCNKCTAMTIDVPVDWHCCRLLSGYLVIVKDAVHITTAMSCH